MKRRLGRWVTNVRKQDIGVRECTKGLLEGPPRPARGRSYEQMVRAGEVGLYERPARPERN